MTAPAAQAGEVVAYLVAQRRGGVWLLGDDWANRCGTLAEARAVAERWRSLPEANDPANVAVLAVTVVPEVSGPERAR